MTVYYFANNKCKQKRFLSGMRTEKNIKLPRLFRHWILFKNKMKKAFRILLWVVVIVNATALIITLLEMWPDNPLSDYKVLLVISFFTFGGILLKIKR